MTNTRASDAGFYLVINGSRLWHKTRPQATAAFQAFLSMQSFQILTVREYARRLRKKK
jgi:hypothetical protein